MNEELNVTEEFEGTPATDVNEVESENTDVRPENKSGGSFSTALLIGGLAFGGYVVGKGIEWGARKAINFGRGLAAKRKVKPDKDGCVAEAEAEEVNEQESTEESEQEEKVQGKSRKKK
ncbi:MAG: hypothetical protein LUI14_14535 [Lachnospiraceae bacterium]|nr:hypothetical protein [Lachnospiraceae bacterium]